MEKIIILVFVFLSMRVLPVFGAQTQQVQQQVQNKNQVKPQNQGEDSNLQVNTQESEGSQNRSQNALENMSEVAKQVQQLLQLKTTGGIGQQVRLIAQEQNQAQTQIKNQIKTLDAKGKIARLLSGTNLNAVNSLKIQLEQNQLRITQLEQLQNQLSGQEDVTMVQETIQALVEQNISLQERITKELQTKSLFGWLFMLLGK